MPNDDVTVNNTVGMPDGFARPANLKPARGGDWDDGDAVTKMEAVEEQAWDYDPDANTDDDPVVSPAVEDNQPEEESESESEDIPLDDLEDEESAEGMETQPNEAPAEKPSRFQARISEVIAEKKAAEARAEAVESKLREMEMRQSSLFVAQERAAKLQEEYLASEMAKQRQSEEAARQQEMLRQLQAKGYDLENPLTWAALEAMEMAAVQRAEIAKMREEQASLKREQAYVAYERSLATSLNSTLKDIGPLDADPKRDAEIRERLYEQAYALAQTKQIADPSQAVAQAVGPLLPILRNAAKVSKPKAKVDPKTAAVISSSGRAAGQQAGTTPSGRTQKKSIEDIEREMGAGKRW